MKFASTDLEKNFVNNHSSLDIQYLLSLKSEMIIATLSFGFFSSTQFIRDCWGTLIRRAAVDISLNYDSSLREELLRMPVKDLFLMNSFHLVPRTYTTKCFFCFSETQTCEAYNVSSHSKTWLRTREEFAHASRLNKLHVIKINECKRFPWVLHATMG